MKVVEHRCLTVVGRGPRWARGFIRRCDGCREGRRASEHAGLVQFTVWFGLAGSLPVLLFAYFALLGFPLQTVKRVGETQLAALGVGTVLEVVVALGIAAAISFRALNHRLEDHARRAVGPEQRQGAASRELRLIDRQNMALFCVSVLLAGLSLLTGVLGRSAAALVLAGVVAASLGVEMIGHRPRVHELETLDRTRFVQRAMVVGRRKQQLRLRGETGSCATATAAVVAVLAPVGLAIALEPSADPPRLVALIAAGFYSGLVPLVLGLVTLDMARRRFAAFGICVLIVIISFVPLLVSSSAFGAVAIFAVSGAALALGGAGVGPLKLLARMYVLSRDRHERGRYEIQPLPKVPSAGEMNAASTGEWSALERNVSPPGWAERRQAVLSMRSTMSRTASIRGPSTP